MNIDEPIKTQLHFLPGDIIYLKQDVLNDRSRLNVNGREVDHFDLQQAYIVVMVHIEVNSRVGCTYQYIVRPQRHFGSEDKFLAVREPEACSSAEAVAIIRLRGANNK